MKEKKRCIFPLLVISIILLPSANAFPWGEIDVELGHEGIYHLNENGEGELELSIKYEPYFIAYFPIWAEIKVLENPSWLVVTASEKAFALQPRESKSILISLQAKSSDEGVDNGEVLIEVVGRTLHGFLRSIESGRIFIEVKYEPPSFPPIVDIISPYDGKEMRGTVAIKGTASDRNGDDTIQRVEIKIDDSPWKVATGTTAWEYIWNTREVNNGNHQIKIRAYDGHEYSDISSVTVEVKNSRFGSEIFLVAIGIIIGILIIFMLKRRR